MKEIVRREGVEDAFHIESKGTSAEELGNGMYPPMAREMQKHGIDSGGHRARRLRYEDYQRFDLLIGMDEENRRNMRRMWKSDPEGKLHQLLEFAGETREVSDPWYTRDFAQAYEDIVIGCEALFRHLQAEEGI